MKALEDAHFDKVLVQYGRGRPPRTAAGSKLDVGAFAFSDNIDKLIAESDLVISHAGELLCTISVVRAERVFACGRFGIYIDRFAV